MIPSHAIRADPPSWPRCRRTRDMESIPSRENILPWSAGTIYYSRPDVCFGAGTIYLTAQGLIKIKESRFMRQGRELTQWHDRRQPKKWLMSLVKKPQREKRGSATWHRLDDARCTAMIPARGPVHARRQKSKIPRPTVQFLRKRHLSVNDLAHCANSAPCAANPCH